MNTKYQASTDIEKEDLSSITQEIWSEPYIPSIPFIQERNVRKCNILGLQQAKEEKL